MSESIEISASIVLYKENIKELEKTIESFLSIDLPKKLYLIDNTVNRQFENIFTNKQIEYIGLGKNVGFGMGHNMILDKIEKTSSFHLILNPDVLFSKEVIPTLVEALKRDPSVAMVAPRVLFPNGEHQFSCRRYPTILELFARRFKFFSTIFKEKINKGVYADKDLTTPFYAEYLTGCFQLYKTKDLVALKGFDERYFLYMEDVDICKKIDVLGKKKLYYPQEVIFHVLKKGSEKNLSLFLRHTMSIIQYFKKWKN